MDTPKIPKFRIKKNDKIGYLIDIKNNPMHTHNGLINSFEKQYPFEWDLEKHTESRLISNLEGIKKHN